MVASLRLSFPRMEAASAHCLRLVGYSLPVRECFTLELVMRMTRPGSARGTEVASRDLRQTTKRENVREPRIHLQGFITLTRCLHYLQSMSKACPSLPRVDTN